MKRVVITGLGAVTPLGNDVDSFWRNAVLGKSGAASITRFDASQFRTQVACEVKHFEPAGCLTRNEIKRSDLFTQYALYSAAEAVEDAGLPLETIDPFDIGVIWGSGQGGMETFEAEVTNYVNQGAPRFNPFFVPKLIANMASGMISMKFGLQGINYTTVSACATSNTALMDAFNYIRLGKAKVFVVGGSEAPITPASVGGFSAMKAMTKQNDTPESASRPFDAQRDGFVIGEGAGALILEDLDHALARGAHIYAELAGAAMTADAYHMTSPHPDGIGALKAMQLALEEAQMPAADISYINMHATSTPIGDLSESRAIASLFDTVSVTSTKSMTGHLLGAAGAIEAILSVKSIENNIIPPTINIVELDKEMPTGLNVVQQSVSEVIITAVMSNAFGFGGHNSTIIFKRYNG